TRFLVISDTHGEEFPYIKRPSDSVDVVIHCGDLTQDSRLEEFHTAVRLLKALKAPLKLVIAGNRDFSLNASLIKRYASFGQARQVFDDAASDGVLFLDEGIHHFDLANGAHLTVYASPYTPFRSAWGFQYDRQVGHNWDIIQPVDIAITHGPPKGILDMTYSWKRIGCPGLFEAIAKAKPPMHCFGHVHESWGAKLIKWQDPMPELPLHSTAIKGEESLVIETLTTPSPKRRDRLKALGRKEYR
ncbi:hypothetical protein F53441_14444, partial [Fusarium austroafricanum]